MKIFILMMMVSTGNGIGLSSTEFTSEEKCVQAGKQVKERFDRTFGSTVIAVCVEK